MAGVDIMELVKSVGLVGVLLAGILIWLGKIGVPSVLGAFKTQSETTLALLREQHSADRASWTAELLSARAFWADQMAQQRLDSAKESLFHREAFARALEDLRKQPCPWQHNDSLATVVPMHQAVGEK